MKTYLTNENGTLSINGMTIPQGHRWYVQAFAEVEAGEAEILPYTEPLPTKAQLDAPHLSTLASTDWYVIRAFETGEPVPQEVLDARESARSSI